MVADLNFVSRMHIILLELCLIIKPWLFQSESIPMIILCNTLYFAINLYLFE